MGEDAYFLAWTTTPWTLPSNVALCVNPEDTYVGHRAGIREKAGHSGAGYDAGEKGRHQRSQSHQ